MSRFRVRSPNIDYISKLSKEYGFKRSTIMSYWKDAAKKLGDVGARRIYEEVVSYIKDDQNLTEWDRYS